MVIAAAAAALFGTAAAGDARPKPDCLRSGRTVAANGSVRVFYRGDADFHVLYACWLARRKVRRLGETFISPDGHGIDKVSIHGRFVASRRFSYDRHGSYYNRVQVHDVRAGRVVASEPAAPDGRGVADIVAVAGGRAAFIEVEKGSVTRVVALADRTRTVLDDAERIDRKSLAVSGSRVYWMRDGEPRTATIP